MFNRFQQRKAAFETTVVEALTEGKKSGQELRTLVNEKFADNHLGRLTGPAFYCCMRDLEAVNLVDSDPKHEQNNGRRTAEPFFKLHSKT